MRMRGDGCVLMHIMVYIMVCNGSISIEILRFTVFIKSYLADRYDTFDFVDIS